MDRLKASDPSSSGSTPKAGAENAGGDSGLGRQLHRFLAAEAKADDAAAEAALAALFIALPAREPGEDFAARVMAGIERLPARVLPAWAARPRDLPRPFRWPLAAALLLAGFAAFYALPALWLLASRLEPGGLLAAAAGWWAGAVQRLAGFAWVLQLFHQLVTALLEVATSPPMLAATLLAATLSVVLSRWLVVLLEPSRRSSHAALS